MSDTVIQVENLSKRYQLGGLKASYGSLRDDIARAIKAPLSALRKHERVRPQEFWALRDVSFEVKQGEILGVIGHNGAGKSTLLKILPRITDPTDGYVRMRGQTRALLEVGTGFHPELSGRENIFLNGAILGMKRSEIERKFTEIVEFAEIQQFLDTPVKHCSSGMYTRLAFSIAAHLEPDILIVDEVLAVGDAAFQQKCLGKMRHVAGEGRTVLFVSHNIGVVQALCSRAMLLRCGTIIAHGPATAVVGAYLRTLEGVAQGDISERTERSGKGEIRFTHITISTGKTAHSATLATGHPARLTFCVNKARPGATCSFTIYDQHGYPITFFDSALHGAEDTADSEQATTFRCDIDELPLLPGRYRINAAITGNGELQDHLEAATFIDVDQGSLRGRPAPAETGYGSVFVAHHWTTPN